MISVFFHSIIDILQRVSLIVLLFIFVSTTNIIRIGRFHMNLGSERSKTFRLSKNENSYRLLSFSSPRRIGLIEFVFFSRSFIYRCFLGIFFSRTVSCNEHFPFIQSFHLISLKLRLSCCVIFFLLKSLSVHKHLIKRRF